MKFASLFTDRLVGWDEATGEVGALSLGSAVEMWSVAQDRPVTCEEAASAFNVTPQLIRASVELHPWISLDGEVIRSR